MPLYGALSPNVSNNLSNNISNVSNPRPRRRRRPLCVCVCVSASVYRQTANGVWRRQTALAVALCLFVCVWTAFGSAKRR